MPLHLVRVIRAVAILAWGVAMADLFPWALDLQPDARLFVVAVACVSTYALICRANARPAAEVYLAGKMMGRMEAEAEMRSGVAHLSERRLRVVDGS